MTTVPAIDRLLSASLIASTAAWSAAFSSPRPIKREAESAAASVTRTASSARLRSILEVSGMAFPPAGGGLNAQILDADHARRFENGVERCDLFKRPAHRRLDSHMGRHDDRHGLARRSAALDHRLHRNLLVAQRRRDIGDHTRLIDHHEPDVIRTLVP